jgi:hypothetical protein
MSDHFRIADQPPRMSYFGPHKVLSWIPNDLLFDLTAVASSYYFDLGLELNSLGS